MGLFLCLSFTCVLAAVYICFFNSSQSFILSVSQQDVKQTESLIKHAFTTTALEWTQWYLCIFMNPVVAVKDVKQAHQQRKSVISLHASCLSDVLLPRMLRFQGDCRSLIDPSEVSQSGHLPPVFVCLSSTWHTVCVTGAPYNAMNTKQLLRSTLQIRGHCRLTLVRFRKWDEMWSVSSKN